MPGSNRFVTVALMASLTCLLQACAPVAGTPADDTTRASSDAPAAAVAGMRCTNSLQMRMYFGFDTPDGVVTEQQWQNFVDGDIVPRLPAGFTLLAARGQWREPDGRAVQEESRVLEVVRAVGKEKLELRRALAEIAGAYKLRFRQQSVLLTESPIRACSSEDAVQPLAHRRLRE